MIKRFDRKESKRIHYASAMTLLGNTDGANALDDIKGIVDSNWRKIAKNYSISRREIEQMTPAFDMSYK